jgi:uncharacterized membrane protein
VRNAILNNLDKAEVRILLFGFVVIISFGLFIFAYSFIDSEFANKISAMAVANVAVGRVPSLSLGYASELSHLPVIATNVVVEMTMVMILYPIFVFSFNNILHVKFLEKFFDSVHELQQKHKDKFDKYGVYGLFVFVFIPFWMTGPIVGSIIGFLIGINHYKVITIVFIATIFAISLWGLVLREFIDVLNAIDTSLIWYILAFAIVLILLFKIKDKFIKKQ